MSPTRSTRSSPARYRSAALFGGPATRPTRDAQFYPDGIRSWMVKLDVNPEGGISFDPNFFLDFGDQRAHQLRLQGGDASTDSYCFP